jgi:hypothetical protein
VNSAAGASVGGGNSTAGSGGTAGAVSTAGASAAGSGGTHSIAGSGGTAGNGGTENTAGSAGTAGNGGTENTAGSAGTAGNAGTESTAGSGGTESTAGSGGTESTAGSGGTESSAGSGGTASTAGSAGTAGSGGGPGGGTGGNGGSSGGAGGSANEVILKYDFTENAGTVAVDSSVNHTDGVLVNTSWATGRNGSAIGLATGTPQVTIPNNVVAAANDFTATAWVYLTANAQWARVFDFGNGVDNYMFLTTNAGAGPRFAIKVNGAAEQIVGVDAAMPLNVWKHIAVTVSAAGGAKMYIDGHQVANNAAFTAKPSDLGNTVNNWIGKSQYPDPAFAGTIDEFYLYRKVLSVAEIEQLAWAKTDYSIYRFDETSGTTAHDASDNARNGTLTGATFSAGRTGYAVDLSGTVEKYVSFPTGVVQNCANLTVAAWINMTANDIWNRVFDFGFNTDSYIFMTPRDWQNHLRFVIKPAGQPEQIVGAAATFNTNTWYHVAAVLEGATGRVYLNGSELANAAPFTTNPAALGATTQNWLGKSQWPDPNFRGQLDDLVISCRAFTPGEIKMLAQ